MTEEELFHAALEKSGSERAAFLDQACAGNAPLRAAVEALLAAHEDPGSFLNPNRPQAQPQQGDPAATQDSEMDAEENKAATGEHLSGSSGKKHVRNPQALTADFRLEPVSGVVIGGRYTLQEKIGEGGMGEVWVAKQTEPVKRKVALKLIKTGMDTRAVLQRFEQERQALALMDHPHIARVLDGGMTPTGQPFFVMELVNGLPLTKFCDELKLSLKERLELFIPICQAVQHAHQKGIVHRDLKPANILVTMIDGKPVPKVIDFGVAKATSGKLTDETMSTGFGAVVGTLEYMSPEQAGFSGEDIDTRSDIYSLGVILYELLTGLRPIDGKRLKQAALNEMIRIIREEEPSKPSTRLSTNESLPSLAAVRQIEPKKLTALLRGELDWVVMKCLEKQRERRYETANGLARDIQRYLADEAVEARPPSAGYRLQKFVRRNRMTVLSVTAVAAALVLGVVGFAWQASIASYERDQAIEAREAEKTQRFRAEENERVAIAQRDRAINAEKAEKTRTLELKQVSDFQSAMLGDIDVPLAGKKLSDYILRQLDEAVADSGLTVDEQALLQQQFRKGWAMVSMTDASRHFIDETIISPSIAAIDTRFASQPLVDALLRQTVASLCIHHSLLAKALPLQLHALKTRERELGESHPDTIHSVGQLSMVYHFQGQQELAATYTQREVELAETHLGVDNKQTADAYNHHSLILRALARGAESEKYLRGALEIRRRVQGPNNHDTIVAESNLADWMLGQGNTEDALALMSDVINLRVPHLPREDRLHVDTRRTYARMLIEAGKLEQADAVLRVAQQRAKESYGIDHRSTIFLQQVVSDLELSRGNLTVAEEVTRELIATCIRVFSNEGTQTLQNRNRLVTILLRQGRLTEAEAEAVEIMDLCKQIRDFSAREKLRIAHNLASVRIAQAKYAEALQILGSIETEYRQAFSTQPGIYLGRLDLAIGEARLGVASTSQEYAEVETYLLAAATRLEQLSNTYREDKRQCFVALVRLYTAWNNAEPEKGHGAKATKWQKLLEEFNKASNETSTNIEGK